MLLRALELHRGNSMKARAVAESYAKEHGLTFVPKGTLPAAAPTLGGSTLGANAMSGAIAGGPPGILFQRVGWRGSFLPSAHYEIPGLGDVVKGMWVCRSGRSIWTRVGLPRRYTELLELPSQAFLARYRVAIASDGDADAARRLLSGDFLAWLTDTAAQDGRSGMGGSFEMWQGVLFIRGPLDAFSSTEKLGAFAAAAARIATEVAALVNSAAPVSAMISHAWICDVCGGAAGSIAVGEDGATRRDSFTSALTQTLAEPWIGRLRAALVAGDSAGVYALDPEFAPWWCPECRKSYCGGHWRHWDVFDEEETSRHDSIRGRCPEGHERMLED